MRESGSGKPKFDAADIALITLILAVIVMFAWVMACYKEDSGPLRNELLPAGGQPARGVGRLMGRPSDAPRTLVS